MKLKTIATASLLAAAAAGANAQTNVTLYGLIDTGIEYITNVGAGGGSLTRMPTLTGGQLPSRWGVRGTEDLGGGLKAVFTLESGFAPDQGTLNQGGRLFGRQAFVGMSSNWGTLTAGRHWTMTFFSLLDSDVIGPAAFGMASFDSYFPNARADNSVSYRGSFSGFSVGATYSLGRDTLASGPSAACAGEGNGCKEYSGMVKYDAASWGVGAAIDVVRGGGAGHLDTVAPTTPGTSVAFANASDRDTRSYLNGYWKFGQGGKVGAGVIHREGEYVASANNFKSNLYYLGTTYPFTQAVVLDAQILRIDHNDRFKADANMLVLRGNYNFSKRTAAYVTVARVDNSSNARYSVSGTTAAAASPVTGEGQTGLMVGMRHSF